MGRVPLVNVGLLGHGAIGRTVARVLKGGGIPGCRLEAVFTRSGEPARGVPNVEGLLSSCDLVVEAAGQAALAEFGPRIVGAGVDLLVLSVGALVDDALYESLQREGCGRLLVSSGAIGGLDIIRAAALAGALEAVSLESRKHPVVLRQPWMDEALLAALEVRASPIEVFAGTAREAARRFPESANVAAALALATVGLDHTRVNIVADPSVDGPRHVIRAAGAAGSHEVTICNAPSEDNPRTSAVTAYAVVRALRDLQAHTVIGL